VTEALEELPRETPLGENNLEKLCTAWNPRHDRERLEEELKEKARKKLELPYQKRGG